MIKITDKPRPPVYKKESDRFTISPKLFVSWLNYLFFAPKGETAIIDLESDPIEEIAKVMQAQIKELKKNNDEN